MTCLKLHSWLKPDSTPSQPGTCYLASVCSGSPRPKRGIGVCQQQSLIFIYLFFKYWGHSVFEREDITCSLTQNILTFLQQSIRKSILLRSVEGTSNLVPGQASVLSPHEWSCRHDVDGA